jgi:shingomyelin synthase
LEIMDDQSKYLKSEKWKAFVAFLVLNFSFFVSSVSLALTHERLPDRETYKPLPDIILDNVDNHDVMLNITEIQIMIAVLVCIVLVTFHKYRFVCKIFM